MRTIELYRYNPDRIPPEELEATFVRREKVLEQIVGDLRRQVGAKANQHFLVTGPRGVGKTNLLLMLRLRVQADEQLRGSYLTLKTAEEEYAIADLLDLFRRIMELAVEATGDGELKTALGKVTDEKNPEIALEKAVQAVKTHSRKSGRKLLLLVDNLDMIIEDQFSDEAQLGRLRDILMNQSFLVVVGAAPTFFREVSGYERPLYGFFMLKELEELDFEGMVALLRKRADWEGNRALLDRLDALRPRLEALFYLTGGNPRLVLMLYQLFVLTELPEVRSSLQMLLDDVTPYYKHRMESLAPQQRKVMDIFARLGRPATPTELAEEARLQVNQVNSILKRLKDAGFVSLAPQERRKTTLYMVSERIFRIWHQMRFSAQGRQRLEFLIEFIRIWYAEADWTHEVDRLRREFFKRRSEVKKEDSIRFIEHLQYIAVAAPSSESRYGLEDETVNMCIESGQCQEAETFLSERMLEYEREGNKERLSQIWYLKARVCSVQSDRPREVEALRKAIELKPDKYEAFYNWATALISWAQGETVERRVMLFREACGKYEQAVAIKPDMHEVFNNWGNTLSDWAQIETGERRVKLYQEACGKYEQAVVIKPDKREAFYNWGVALSGWARVEISERRVELLREACRKYEQAVAIKPDDHEAFNNWGNTLIGWARVETGERRVELFREACKKYEQAVAIKPDKYEALYNWANALIGWAQSEIGERRVELYRKAGGKYEQAVGIKPDHHEALNNWGNALREWALLETVERRVELFREAYGKYEQAVMIKPDHHEVFYNWGNTLSDWALVEAGERRVELFKEACGKYELAVAIKVDDYEVFNNWGLALSDWARGEAGERGVELFKEACKKHEQAVAIKADDHEAFNNWGNALSRWARVESGPERVLLLEQAIEKVYAAFQLAERGSDASAAAFYAFHMVHLLLNQCQSSIEADNRGDAGRAFSAGLDWLHRAELEKRRRGLALFFRQALREKTAEVCKMLLDELAARGFDEEIELLAPFREAVNYWTSGKNKEVLDRLNPEMRNLVEEIIRGGSPEKDDRGEVR